ncbi:hypothetical protein DCM91_02900 [Chitinophaga costaii]|nr:hypothetical protein [Chitinophaga costaii]PUZ30437.1 hypothetical protein DCM91_02900 [Chitinophaga costaii]
MDTQGRIAALQPTTRDQNYAVTDTPGYLLQIVLAQKTISPVSARFDKNNIYLQYPAGQTAVVNVTKRNTYLRFELKTISKGIDAVIWGPINTTVADTIGNMIGVVRTAYYALGIQALNKKTSGGVLQNEEGAIFDNGSTARATSFGAALQAFTVNRSVDRTITVWDTWHQVPLKAIPDGKLEGSAIALFGCTPGAVLTVLENITSQENLPYATWNKKWIKTSPESGRPYMITRFNENNIDTFLHYAKSMGLAGVYHEGPFKTWGHFVLDSTEFPHGIKGFKACVDKAHALGLRLGFHTLTNFITTNDTFVSPVPDPHLMTAGSATLTGNISADATKISVSSPTYFEMRSELNSVRIGNEIVRFREVSKTAPYQLLGCIRGAFGTQRNAHAQGNQVSRLIDHSYKVFFPDWELQQKLASNVIRFINETGADQMDFDGHEGTYATGMGDLSFNTFAESVFKGANHPMVFGSSRANHYFWHFNNYLNWGEPWYGSFRESQSDLRITNQAFYERNYLPNMLGWFLITEQTTSDDIDWMLGRAAGYNAGYALVVREKALSNPHISEITAQINLWTSAQTHHSFSMEQRTWLKNPANEVHLYQENDALFMQRFSKYEFNYEAKNVQPGEPTTSTWSFKNPASAQYAQLVLLCDGKEGKVNKPVLELDHSFHIELPVTLAAGESLVIGKARMARLYDAKGRFLKEIDLGEALPQMTTGDHELSFDATMDTGAHAHLTVKLVTGTEKLKGEN